jgi:hypothetical protein
MSGTRPLDAFKPADTFNFFQRYSEDREEAQVRVSLERVLISETGGW